jgi:hypothetical protein
MSKFLAIGLSAAAVVVALVVGAQLLAPAPGGVGAPTAAPSAEPTATAEPSVAVATPEPTPVGLPEGPHLLLSGQGETQETDTTPLTITIPAPGWEGDEGGGILLKDWGQPAPGAGMIVFNQSAYDVFGDPCHWQTTMPDEPVTTVDEFIAALSSQPGRGASEPVDITVGGHTGKAITLHIPDDAALSDCDQGIYASWNCGSHADPSPCGFHIGPGETNVEYILDVDGAIMAWHTGYEAGAPPEVVAELESIVQSATFGE